MGRSQERPTFFYEALGICRSFVMSRNGGAPKNRLYSRLNCEGLS